jgi:hypothetical protein
MAAENIINICPSLILYEETKTFQQLVCTFVWMWPVPFHVGAKKLAAVFEFESAAAKYLLLLMLQTTATNFCSYFMLLTSTFCFSSQLLLLASANSLTLQSSEWIRTDMAVQISWFLDFLFCYFVALSARMAKLCRRCSRRLYEGKIFLLPDISAEMERVRSHTNSNTS